MKNRFYNFKKESDTSANLYIYGDIVSDAWWSDSEVDPYNFKNQLNDLGDIEELNVHINSYGGDTFAGFTIHNLLKQNKAKINVYVDGIAASAASIIAMAGDRIYMPKTSLMMIHNCWTWACGNAKELRKTAEDMDKIGEAIKASYLDRIKIDEKELDQLLDEESLMTAQECVEKGFADEILEKSQEDCAQNVYSNKTLLNIFNKAKVQKNDKKLSEEEIDKISLKISNILETSAKEIADSILKEKMKVNSEKEPVGIINDSKQNKEKGSWESFFNTKK